MDTLPPVAKRADPAAISYERGVAWYTRKRYYYFIVLLLLGNMVATTSITWGPIVMKEFQATRDARRVAKAKAAADAQLAAAHQAALANNQLALAYNFPAGQVVYSEDSAEAEKLLTGGGFATVRSNGLPNIKMPQAPVRMIQPINTTAFSRADFSDPNEAILFIHGRSTPESHKMRLIFGAISTTAQLRVSRQSSTSYHTLNLERSLAFYVYDPQSVSGDGRRLWRMDMSIISAGDKDMMVMVDEANKAGKVVQAGSALRLMAGRPDPANASQWFIDYTLEGVPGTITARLREDDRIELDLPGPTQPLLMRFDETHGTIGWQPRNVKPATRPGTDHPTPATGRASTSPAPR
jgi:hypothetical protein